ncbi:MAG TPA: FAD-dependent thymidylate synthase [Candidatus Saccharimonadales bacterium]|nr:FAD-dependent thymidylate synthase [Candidatus Saccharimonadales bacterium]
MKDQPGSLIVLEGTDGSGKSTQFELLKQRLNDLGHHVEYISFPQYDEESSVFVRKYLNGEFGSSKDVGPYTASMFYALDRYFAVDKIRKWLAEDKVILVDRYTGSNMAHQGTFFDNAEERRGFFLWLDQIEFEMLKIPRPDISIVLRVPANVASENISKRGEERDILESSNGHLNRSIEVYDNLCDLFPKDFKRIDCVRNGQMLEREKVNDLVWQSIEPLLPNAPGKKKDTNQDEAELESYVTNLDRNIYAVKSKLASQTIAAAMARLSRKYDDLRNILKDEFVGKDGNDQKLLKKIISEYGDDSVQQLAGQHIVVENASNLLTKKLEKGRLGAYLEQSTRYIYYDKKDREGRYKYYTPSNFDTEVADRYQKSMDYIFDQYSHVVHRLTDYIRSNTHKNPADDENSWRAATKALACDMARPMLPVSSKSTVGMYLSGQSLEHLVIKLLADETSEARQAGKDILEESRKVIPVFLERADKPGRGADTTEYLSRTKAQTESVVKEQVKSQFSVDMKLVNLADYWPKNELDIIADICFEFSSLSLSEIKSDIEKMPVEKKREIILKYIGQRTNRRQKPGRALEKIHYSWDILCDYGIFRDLARHRIVDNMDWQELSPRFGYSIPDVIEEAGLADHFISCFDESLSLYNFLEKRNFKQESQYATLLGHRMRWKVTFNAREAFHILELRTSPQGHPGYRKLAQEIHKKIAEIHPVIASSMKFVNHDNEQVLGRIEAEKRARTSSK